MEKSGKLAMKKRKSGKAPIEPVQEVKTVGPYRNIEEAKKH
jgi:hypothetical protein